MLAAGKHTIVFDFQPDEAGFGKGSTGVLKRNVVLAEIRFNQIYDVERGAASTLSTPVLRVGNGIRFGLSVALEQ